MDNGQWRRRSNGFIIGIYIVYISSKQACIVFTTKTMQVFLIKNVFFSKK
jgi:hypothetical protein